MTIDSSFSDFNYSVPAVPSGIQESYWNKFYGSIYLTTEKDYSSDTNFYKDLFDAAYAAYTTANPTNQSVIGFETYLKVTNSSFLQRFTHGFLYVFSMQIEMLDALNRTALSQASRISTLTNAQKYAADALQGIKLATPQSKNDSSTAASNQRIQRRMAQINNYNSILSSKVTTQNSTIGSSNDAISEQNSMTKSFSTTIQQILQQIFSG